MQKNMAISLHSMTGFASEIRELPYGTLSIDIKSVNHRFLDIQVRLPDTLREIKFTRQATRYAEGAVMTEFGFTKVLCTASIEEKVPSFLKGKNQGWLTAEYGMLPRSTHTRMQRESVSGKQSGRTQEIQRLIGRSLRAVVNLGSLGERTIHLDCDVIQADGGTRTASITGAYVALYDAVHKLMAQGVLTSNPIIQPVAAISVGVYQGLPVLDLDYEEDSACDTDMNVVMTEDGRFIELQGTAEGEPFSRDSLQSLLGLAELGCRQLIELQKQVLAG